VYDGNACFHSLKYIPGNFSQISAKLFGMIGKAGDVVEQYAAKLHGRRVIFICEGTAYLLTSHDGHETVKEELPALKPSQEKTDLRIILYANYARTRNYRFV